MAGRRSKFLIGLFVIVGLTIGTVIIIWVGASNYFMKGTTYVSYFDESVQGLQTDSAVKYRGVEIGKVEIIRIARDNRLVEVIMKINLSGDLRDKIVAQLRTTGITGIVFIELDLINPAETADFVKVGFDSDYPVLPSRRSDISRLLADANKVMNNFKQIDLKGIAEQIKNTAKTMETLLADKRIISVMNNLESLSANLDKTVAKVNKIVGDGQVEGIVKETAAALADARLLIKRAKQEIESMKLAETTNKSAQIMNNVNGKTQSIIVDLQDTAENLRVTSENLQALAESLNNNPSELLFDRPAPPKKNME